MMKRCAGLLMLLALLLGASNAAASVNFAVTTALPTSFIGHVLVASPKYLYHLGGMGGISGVLDGNKVYYAALQEDASVGGWASGVELPDYLLFHGAAYWNGTLYALGGYHYHNGLRLSDQVYYSRVNADGSPGAWGVTLALPQPLVLLSAAVWEGTLYVTGGWGPGGLSKNVYAAAIQANGSLGAWRVMPPLPSAVYAHAAVENGALYVIGGGVNGGASLSNEVYYSLINADSTLAGWKSGASLPVPVADHAAAVIGGKIYVAGGWTGSQPGAGVYVAPSRADGSVGVWESGPNLPMPLYFHAAASANGCLYVSGGSNGSTPQKNVYFARFIELPLPLVATVDLNPNTLNLMSNGNYVTSYLEFAPVSGSAADINAGSMRIVTINGAAIAPIPAVAKFHSLDDDNRNGVLDLMIKFNRPELQAVLSQGDSEIGITGQLNNGKIFTGTAKVWGIQPHSYASKVQNTTSPQAMQVGSHVFGMLNSKGGRIRAAGFNSAWVDVPENAVKHNLGVTMMPASGDGDDGARGRAMGEARKAAMGQAMNFGPEGMTFDKEISVRMSYSADDLPKGAQEQDLAIHYWNPNSGQWEKLASQVDSNSKIVSAQTAHFSVYQLLVTMPFLPPPEFPAPQPQSGADAIASIEPRQPASLPRVAQAPGLRSVAPGAQGSGDDLEKMTREAAFNLSQEYLKKSRRALESGNILQSLREVETARLWDTENRDLSKRIADLKSRWQTSLERRNVQRLDDQASKALKRGQLRLARRYAEEALEIDRADIVATALLERMNRKLSREMRRRLEARHRARISAKISDLLKKSLTMLRTSRFTQARFLAEKALSLDSSRAQSRKMLGDINRGLNFSVTQRLAEADRQILKRSYAGAAEVLELVLRDDPNNAKALGRQAELRSLEEKATLPETRQKIERLYYLAVAHYAKEDFKSAISLLAKIRELDAVYPPAAVLEAKLKTAPALISGK